MVVTAVADEELASSAPRRVARARARRTRAIVVEPTELEVAIAHKGFAGFEIETHGVAAHGSRPDLGVDAIAKMGPVLVASGASSTSGCRRSRRIRSSGPARCTRR